MSLLSRATVDKAKINKLAKKIQKVEKKKPTMKKGESINDKIMNIAKLVQAKLGKYESKLELISTIEELHDYITHSINFGSIAIDTETTGLDPITDQIVGACIYTPGKKAAYIPINHISAIARQRVANQLTEKQVADEFQRLVDANTKTIFFNAKFDIRFMRHQLGVYIKPYWDCMIASRCLKENEPEGSLKYLWKKYCSPDKDAPHFTFDKFFSGITFNLIPLKTAYLYAANDAIMTYELYEFQKPWLDENDEKCISAELQGVSKLFKNIETPITDIIADIEDTGVTIDVDYCYKLSEKYNKILQQNIDNFYKALEPYQDKITSWVNSHPNTKLENPINVGSPAQLAELFYDILQQPVVKKKEPRGTGSEILKAMNHPLCGPILDYRGTAKLLSTYIDKMPTIVNKKTGKIHCTFKQIGAATGRMASADPNLQNIPSQNHEIRLMFVASKDAKVKIKNKTINLLVDDIVPLFDEEKKVQDLKLDDIIISNKKNNLTISSITNEDRFYTVIINEDIEDDITVKREHVMVGADYSQQEPKITADLSNDEQFIADCAAGKDAYGTVASLAFNKPYEDCLEFYLDENGKKTDKINHDGKDRRTQSKSILLGICYGRSIETIAEQLKCTKEKAQEIYDSVLRGLPGLKNLIEAKQNQARTKGYVTTKWGRRRYIPEMQYEPYEITSQGSKNFDPFFDSEALGVVDDTQQLINKYKEELANAKYPSQKRKIIEKANADGFKVKDHVKDIEDAKRQCVNSAVQGSAADQTKIAMRLIGTNKDLKKYLFNMILLVHDEIIGEVPLVTAKFAIPIFTQCMIDAAADLRTGAACDATIVKRWYDDQYGNEIKFEDLP